MRNAISLTLFVAVGCGSSSMPDASVGGGPSNMAGGSSAGGGSAGGSTSGGSGGLGGGSTMAGGSSAGGSSGGSTAGGGTSGGTAGGTSGGAGGGFRRDAGDSPVERLLANTPAGTWTLVPSSKMRDVCPQPLRSSPCEAVQTAWSGAAWDGRRERMVVFGGGHGDSWYNNLFAFDLGELTWSRLTELPSNASSTMTSPAIEFVPLESCGYYPRSIPALDAGDFSGNYLRSELCDRPDIDAVLDRQQPRSSHTYGKLFYDEARDRFCYLGGGTYPSAQTFTPWPTCYSFITSRWEQLPSRPSGVGGRGTSATDADGGLWYLTDSSGPIARMELDGGTWRLFGNLNYDADGTADVDRRRNHLWLLQDQGYSLFRYDLNDTARLMQSRGAPDRFDAGMTAEPGARRRSGFVYADARDRFYAWVGGRDVFEFNPAARQWRQLGGLGDDPGMPLSNGTYGRFRYSPRHDVLVLVNGATKDVFLFKLP